MICSFLLHPELILFTDCWLCKGNVKHKDPTTDIYHIHSIEGTVFYDTSPHCIFLYFTVLYCTSQFVTVLHCTFLYLTILQFTSMYINVLHCTSLYFIVLHFTPLFSTDLFVLYCISFYFNVLSCTALYFTLFH